MAQAPDAEIALRTSHFIAQLIAAQEPGRRARARPYVARYALTPLSYARKLAPSSERWPVDDLWLVSHRALSDVPRVAAVWEFLAREFRNYGGNGAA